MKILVVSDTHGTIEKTMDVYEKLNMTSPVDLIIHCGDYYDDALEIKKRVSCAVVAVMGNCDGSFDDGEYKIVETEAGNIFMAHGHRFDVDYSQERIYYKALEEGCIGAIFGHTHRSVFYQNDECFIMNPGSLTLPKDGTLGTFGLLITNENGVNGQICEYHKFMDVGEGGFANNQKPKIKGGHLRDMINYSDRF